MPLIPILEIEPKLQVGDKTRAVATKSFQTKDITAPLTQVNITMGDAAAINVYDDDPRERFLDWVFDDFKFDIDNTMNKIYLNDNGTPLEVDVAPGTYDLAGLLVAIETAVNAIASQVYNFELSDKQEIEVTAPSPFEILVRNQEASLLSYLSFSSDSKLATSAKGGIIEKARRKVVIELSNGTDTASKTYYFDLYSEYGDRLFSSDSDLVAEEADILQWTEAGRSTHLNVHRKAQERIVEWINRQGYRLNDQSKITKWSFLDLSEVRLWSAYLSLQIIFSGNSNAVDDIFKDKAKEYAGLVIEARNQAIINLDLNKDGDPDKFAEIGPSTWSGTMFRR